LLWRIVLCDYCCTHTFTAKQSLGVWNWCSSTFILLFVHLLSPLRFTFHLSWDFTLERKLTSVGHTDTQHAKVCHLAVTDELRELVITNYRHFLRHNADLILKTLVHVILKAN
jgi:hypothetical protein